MCPPRRASTLFGTRQGSLGLAKFEAPHGAAALGFSASQYRASSLTTKSVPWQHTRQAARLSSGWPQCLGEWKSQVQSVHRKRFEIKQGFFVVCVSRLFLRPHDPKVPSPRRARGCGHRIRRRLMGAEQLMQFRRPATHHSPKREQLAE